MLWLTALLVASAQGARLLVTPGINPIQKPVGEQLNLLCSVDGGDPHTPPGMIWSKHGGIDKTGNAEVNRLDPLTLSLVILNTTVADSGVYTCKATTKDEVLLKSFDVIFFEDLKFVESDTQVGEVLSTASVNISCKVDAEHSEGVITTWSRNGKLIVPGEKFKFYEKSAILELNLYDPSKDAGNYGCRVLHILSGSAIHRNITIGGAQDHRKTFCNNMCTNLCLNMYNNFHN